VTGPCHEQGSGDEGGLRGMGNDIRVIRDQRHVGSVSAASRGSSSTLSLLKNELRAIEWGQAKRATWQSHAARRS
jgi:hypothetical protein